MESERVTPGRWSRVRELFDAAILLDPGERETYLDQNCGDDAELRREIEALLAHDTGPGDDRDDPIREAVSRAANEVVGRETIAPADSLIGQRVGNIRVQELLGRGGMGEVYAGFDETLQRRVALKSIRARHRLAASARARFLREARVLSQLEHPNICRIHDYVEGEDRDFLVLELIDGKNLAAAIKEGLDPALRLRVATQIATVLEAAHGQGVVHRDLKPPNVMLTGAGQVKVLDFGLARPEWAANREDFSHQSAAATPAGEAAPEAATEATRQTLEPTLTTLVDEPSPRPLKKPVSTDPRAEIQTALGAVMGTPSYMSPEQARGEQVTTASDMYSFGLLLQVLFTGRGPYPATAGRKEIRRRAEAADTLPTSGLGTDLTRLIEALKSAAPAARPTAVETAGRLRWIADRPKRRAKWLAAAAALAILVLGGLKYTIDLRHERTIAVQARDEADLRRSQAEDLIGFMLGDLREKLAPVGRLDILDDVGDKAMDYFATLSEGLLSDDELARRSKALYQIGDVRMAQGSLAAAKAALYESLALARSLFDRDPGNTERLFGLGQSHFWVGYVHLRLGELDEAEGQFQAYYDASKRLAELNPRNPEWQLELAYSHNNLGEVRRRQGQFDRSLDHYRASAEIRGSLVEAQPGEPKLLRDLAHARSLLGQMLASHGQIDDAVTEHRSALEIRQRLLALDPAHAEWQWNVSISRQHLGRLGLWKGRLDEALEHFGAAVASTRELVARDPENARWQRSLAVAQSWIGHALVARGSARLGLESLTESERMLDDLVRLEPDERSWQVDLAIARIRIADGRLAIGDARAARQNSGRARTPLEVLAADDPQSPRIRASLARAANAEGRALQRLGLLSEAAAAWARGLAAIEPVARDSSDPDLLEPWAEVLLHLERFQEAEPILAQLEHAGYWRPTLERLTKDHASRIYSGADMSPRRRMSDGER